MTPKNTNSIVRFEDKERILDIASFVSSAVPWIGGPVSNVLGGISTSRKIKRVNEILHNVAEDLKDFKSEISEQYVKTEDFEELLEQTLRRTSEERNEEKRKALKSFLVEAIQNPGEQYDDQLRFLKLLENIYGDHIKILKAIIATPGKSTSISGTQLQTLKERLPDLDENRIQDLVQQLNDLRITDLQNLRAMMTGNGSKNLRHSLTSIGNRFIGYLKE